MKYKWIIILGFLIVIAGFPLIMSSNSQTKEYSENTYQIRITTNGFEPNELKIPVNSEVTFINDDSVMHSVISETFDLGLIAPGETTFKFFDEAGIFNFNCLMHPQISGKITID